MKELIESVVFAIGLIGVGTYTLKEAHDTVRKAALTKVAQGLPSLTGLTATLRSKR